MFKLYKQEGKLKEDRGEGYIGGLSSLKEYTVIADDWKDFEEGAEVKEFVLQHQWIDSYGLYNKWEDTTEKYYLTISFESRRIIARPAKPSAKEKAEDTDKILVENGYDPAEVSAKGTEIASKELLKGILKDMAAGMYREMGGDWCGKMIDRINNLK